MNDQWIEWLQDKQRHFFYGVLFVIAAFFIAFQIYGKYHKPRTASYLAANQAFEKWLHQGEAFDRLEKTIQAHPELEAKFGALIAERFIAQKEGEKAEAFADAVLSRVHKHTPDHADFARGSVLIAKGELGAALDQALSLKERLDSKTLLYGFNLVRIASLTRALGAEVDEIAALEQLQEYLNSNGEASSILSECFKEGELTLQDYIKERKAK